MAEERSHMVTGRSGSFLHGLMIVVLFILALLFLLPFYVIFRNAFSSSEAFVAAWAVTRTGRSRRWRSANTPIGRATMTGREDRSRTRRTTSTWAWSADSEYRM